MGRDQNIHRQPRRRNHRGADLGNPPAGVPDPERELQFPGRSVLPQHVHRGQFVQPGAGKLSAAGRAGAAVADRQLRRAAARQTGSWAFDRPVAVHPAGTRTAAGRWRTGTGSGRQFLGSPAKWRSRSSAHAGTESRCSRRWGGNARSCRTGSGRRGQRRSHSNARSCCKH